jgi:predicted lipid-binding transport protein (Tim44 family)
VTVEIVILAMIAAFLGLRLYSVLGRRAEHEEEPIAGRFEGPSGAPRGAAAQRGNEDKAAASAAGAARVRELPRTTPLVERGLQDIVAADRRFDAFAFVDGAKTAYKLVLEAFWRGDREELRQFCDEEVYQGFAQAIDAREAAGEQLDNRLIRIEEALISSAQFEAPYARISVRFRSDIAAVTRDADGNVIAGSLDDAIESLDVWTFVRDVRSPDPDWMIEETDEG